MSDIVGHLHSLRDRFDGLGIDHLLSRINMSHDQTEEPEEQEEECQTEEHDTHGKQRNTDTVRILTLQIGVFRLVGLDEVLDAGSDILCRLYAPLVAVTGVTLVCGQGSRAEAVVSWWTPSRLLPAAGPSLQPAPPGAGRRGTQFRRGRAGGERRGSEGRREETDSTQRKKS